MGKPYWKRNAADKLRFLASEIEAGEDVNQDTLEELAVEIEGLRLALERLLYAAQSDLRDCGSATAGGKYRIRVAAIEAELAALEAAP